MDRSRFRLSWLAAAVALAFGGEARAQWLWDSFDFYDASPAGVPLAGQGGWTTPAGAADWDVYTFDGNPFGLEQPFGSAQFAAGVGPGLVGGKPGVAAALHPMTPTGSSFTITARVAVVFTGRPPAGEEIGRTRPPRLGTPICCGMTAPDCRTSRRFPTRHFKRWRRVCGTNGRCRPTSR